MNPDVAEPHHGLGLLAERERRPDRAAEHYRAALRVDPGFFPARANLGRVLYESGQLEAARMTFHRLVEVAPQEAVGFIGLSETLIRLGRIAEADRVVLSARERFPDHPGLQLLVARVTLRRGDAEAAMRVLVPLVARRDEYASAALAWLATAELARGRPRHAIGAAQQSLSLEPHQPVATSVLAEALARVGDPAASAWRERARALGQNPQ